MPRAGYSKKRGEGRDSNVPRVLLQHVEATAPATLIFTRPLGTSEGAVYAGVLILVMIESLIS